MRRLAIAPYHPVVFAAVIIFAAYLDADVSIHAALRSFAIVVGLVAFVTVVAIGVHRQIGPIVVTGAILIVRSGDPLHAGIALLLVLLVAAAWFVARALLPVFSFLADPNRLLNIVTASLAVATLIVAALTGTLGRISVAQGQPFSAASPSEVAPDPTRPDIYLILLDGYPRYDTLKRLFGFDNAPFLAALGERGFEVAGQSRSNYMYTAVALTSVMHMTYVHEIEGTVVTGTPYEASLRALINRNPVWDRLRSVGYQVAANQSPWETVGMRDADLFCGDQINDFELYLLRTTILGPVVNAINPAFQGDQHRDIINQAFDCLARISARTASPKAVFIHVGGPHLPVVFTRSGAAASPKVFGQTAQELDVSDQEFAAAYTQEVEYLNARILEAVDRLADRPDHPIVVVWSDHGSELHLDWADSARSDLQERFSNFFAARTPSKPSVFPADMTPINLFPLLFNTYLDTAIPLHEARFFLSPIHNRLEFTEIPDPAPPAADPL